MERVNEFVRSEVRRVHELLASKHASDHRARRQALLATEEAREILAGDVVEFAVSDMRDECNESARVARNLREMGRGDDADEEMAYAREMERIIRGIERIAGLRPVRLSI